MTDPLRRHSRRARRWIAVVAACVFLLGGSLIVWAFTPTASSPALSDSAVDWPVGGSSALAIGDEILTSSSADRPVPMASLTKLVTALVVLESAPLSLGQQGPTFQMTEADVALAEFEQQRGGVFTTVAAGQAFTEHQLLEHMLVGSSNNLATTLVVRIFGSEHGFVLAAQSWLDEQGLAEVQIADASGMSPQSQASARDLIFIGRMAADNPVIAEITAQPWAPSPDGNRVYSTNDLLDTQGITGLKTGFTQDAGYTVIFTTPIADSDEQLIGVVLGSPSQAQRATDVTRLIARVRMLLEQ